MQWLLSNRITGLHNRELQTSIIIQSKRKPRVLILKISLKKRKKNWSGFSLLNRTGIFRLNTGYLRI